MLFCLINALIYVMRVHYCRNLQSFDQVFRFCPNARPFPSLTCKCPTPGHILVSNSAPACMKAGQMPGGCPGGCLSLDLIDELVKRETPAASISMSFSSIQKRDNLSAIFHNSQRFPFLRSVMVFKL